MAIIRCLLLVSIVLFSTLLRAATIFVDISSTATPPDGSELRPFLTIAEALSAAADGDEIVFNPGTYTESLVISKRIVLRGVNRETCILQAPAPDWGIHFTAPATPASALLRVENLSIIQQDQTESIMTEDETEITVSVPGGIGINVSGNGIPMINSVTISGFAEGVEATATATIENSTVSSNELGIFLTAGCAVSDSTISSNETIGVLCLDCLGMFTNNTISDNGVSGMSFYGSPPFGDGGEITAAVYSPEMKPGIFSAASQTIPAFSIRESRFTGNKVGITIEDGITDVPDFGSASSPGNNSFRNNRDYSFKNNSTIRINAVGNSWQHENLEQADVLEIFDDEEGKGKVIIKEEDLTL